MEHHEHAAHEGKKDFLDTVYDHTVGGFGIVWTCLLLIIIFLVVAFG